MSDIAILDGLARSAQVDVLEAIDRLCSVCRPRVHEGDLDLIDEALAQLRQADARLGMGIEAVAGIDGVPR